MTICRLRTNLILTSGTSNERLRHYPWSMPVRPFSVGTAGDWLVEADGVEPVHLYLAFDGRQMHVAAYGSARVLLGEVEVGREFVPVSIPAELRFGSARLSFSCDEISLMPDFSVHAEPNGSTPYLGHTQLLELPRIAPHSTQVLDLSTDPRLSEQVNQLRATARVELDAPREPETRAAPAREFEPSKTATLSLKAHWSSSTMCDGGALRELAARIATAKLDPAPPATDGVPDEPSHPDAEESRVELRRFASGRALLGAARSRCLAEWRAASIVKRAAFALLPFAACAALWSPSSADAEAVPAKTPSEARPKPPISAVEAASPTTDSGATRLAVANSELGPSPPVTPARREVVANTATAPAAITLQRDAFNAVFEGKLSDAAALYDRLATGSNAPVFALAARLARADAVRKPR